MKDFNLHVNLCELTSHNSIQFQIYFFSFDTVIFGFITYSKAALKQLWKALQMKLKKLQIKVTWRTLTFKDYD